MRFEPVTIFSVGRAPPWVMCSVQGSGIRTSRASAPCSSFCSASALSRRSVGLALCFASAALASLTAPCAPGRRSDPRCHRSRPPPRLADTHCHHRAAAAGAHEGQCCLGRPLRRAPGPGNIIPSQAPAAAAMSDNFSNSGGGSLPSPDRPHHLAVPGGRGPSSSWSPGRRRRAGACAPGPPSPPRRTRLRPRLTRRPRPRAPAAAGAAAAAAASAAVGGKEGGCQPRAAMVRGGRWRGGRRRTELCVCVCRSGLSALLGSFGLCQGMSWQHLNQP